MKKVLFVTGTLGKGGAERVISILANEFSNKNIDTTLLTLCDSENVQKINDTVKFVDLNKEIGNVSGVGLLFKRAKYLRKYIIENNIDTVISFQTYINIIAAQACLKLDKKLILCERTDPYSSPQLLKYLRKIYYGRGDCFVFQTSDAKKYFSKKIQSKSHVIKNPVDVKGYKWQGNLDAFKLIMVGRIIKSKNYEMILNVINNISEIYSNITLEIHGSGAYKCELLKHVNNKKLHRLVKFVDYNNKIYQSISESSVYILTSKYEGLPNSLMEALAIGIPCISVDCPIGGPKSLIDNGENGYLIDFDENQLEEKIKYIFKNREIQYAVSKQAQEKAKEYSVDNICKEWLLII